MRLLNQAKYEVEPHEVTGGFNFTLLKMNTPMFYSGILNQCELMFNDNPEWMSEYCSPHFHECYVRGMQFNTRSKVDEILIKKSNGRKRPLGVPQKWMRETHDCHGWDPASRKLYKKQCEMMQFDIWDTMNKGHPDLANLDLFFARCGATVSKQTLAGRYLTAISPYYQLDTDVISDIHDHYVDFSVLEALNVETVKKFDDITGWDVDELIANYNSNITDKNSKPPFSREIEENFSFTTSEEIKVQKFAKSLGMKEPPKLWSWNFFITYMHTPNISKRDKQECWNSALNWYMKAIETVKDIIECQNRISRQPVGQYDELGITLIQPDPMMMMNIGQRSSIGIYKAEKYVDQNGDFSVKWKGKEDKIRLVGRGFNAGASLHPSRKNQQIVYEATDRRYVCSRAGWLRSKRARSGNDLSKCDYLTGAVFKLFGVGRLTKSGKLFVTNPPLVSGDEHTMDLNTLLRYFLMKAAKLLRYVIFIQGDDEGHNGQITEKEIIRRLMAKFAISYQWLKDKQTGYYSKSAIQKHAAGVSNFVQKGVPITDRETVFNLGTASAYDGNDFEQGHVRSEKSLKTEQSPSGVYSDHTSSWRYKTESKARFSDIYPNEKELWFSKTLSQFYDFMKSLPDWNVLSDIPGSLRGILRRPRLPVLI